MIRISPIRVIGQTGEQIGVIETSQALQLAKEAGLDLVEISPNTRPPVCKIMDHGKHQYLQAKKEQKSKAKQKKTVIKGIRIRPSTSDNDLEFKMKQAEKFLKKGAKVKVEILLRGREKAFMDQARERLQGFIDKIENPIRIEQPIQRQFNGFNMVIAPK